MCVANQTKQLHFHALFALADANGDAKLNEQEYVLLGAALADPDVKWQEVHSFDFVDAGVADLLRLADADGDGAIGRAEVRARFALFGTVGSRGVKQDEL